MPDLIEIPCRGCKRLIAVGNGPPMHKVWCSEICANDWPVTDNEDRDAIIETLARLRDWTPTRVAMNFDITRPRAQQILRERLVR